MEELDLDGLDRASADFDAHVLASPDVDLFCSSSTWALPAALGLMPGRVPFVRRTEHGFLALMAVPHGRHRILQPLEAMWGLGCPVVGEGVLGLAGDLAGALHASAPRDILLLTGLDHGSERFQAIVRALAPRYHLELGPTTRRLVASLEGGLDGFLGRRSPKLRTNLRRSQRMARDLGVSFEPCAITPEGAALAYARLLAIDARSWKGREEMGIAASSMIDFYRLMIRRLAERGTGRLLFARREGRDVAYIFGGLFAGTYRGLQFAFDADLEACSLGNLCQLEQITRLTGEGVSAYDLGSDVEYKVRWGEQAKETVALIAYPQR